MKSDFLAKISLTGSFMRIYRVLWFCSFAVLFCTVCPGLHLPLNSQFRAIMALFSPKCVLALNVWFVNILSAQLFTSPEGLSALTPFLQFPLFPSHSSPFTSVCILELLVTPIVIFLLGVVLSTKHFDNPVNPCTHPPTSQPRNF